MKKFLIAVLAAVFSLTALGQLPPRNVGRVNAALYGQYILSGGSPVTAAAGQTVTFSNPSQCFQSAGQRSFSPIATSVPLKIVDVISGNTETVTPSSVVATVAACSFTATFANAHNSFTVQSGTGGLQEAINDNSSIGGTLLLDLASTTSTANITAATGGSATLSIEDLRSGYATTWTWNGSAYGNHLSLPGSAPDISGTGASPLTVTFSKAFSVAPICLAGDQSATPAAIQIAPTTTNVVFTGTAGHTVAYVCWGIPR